jgi:hypothetical protein
MHPSSCALYRAHPIGLLLGRLFNPAGPEQQGLNKLGLHSLSLLGSLLVILNQSLAVGFLVGNATLIVSQHVYV